MQAVDGFFMGLSGMLIFKLFLLAFAKYQERTQSPYSRLGYKLVTFTEYVSAIRVGNLTIEFLPREGEKDMIEIILPNINSALSPKNQAHQIWVSVVNEENMLDKDLGKKILQLIEKDMQYQE
jgi:hypothetical protein